MLEQSDSQAEGILTDPSMTTGGKGQKGLYKYHGRRLGPKSKQHAFNFSALLLASTRFLVFEHNIAFVSPVPYAEAKQLCQLRHGAK